MKNDPLYFEWVIWFEDKNLISNYTRYGTEVKYKEAYDYAKKISPMKRAGWVPFSPEKRKIINQLAEDTVVESIPLGARFIECDDIDRLWIRTRNAYTMPMGPAAPPAHRLTYYILGMTNDPVDYSGPDIPDKSHMGPGIYVSMDNRGNVRIDNKLNVVVPIIPPDAPDKKPNQRENDFIKQEPI